MKKNIKTLKDPVTGVVIHPVTVGDAVYLDNGTRLEDNIRYCRNKSTEIGDLSKLLTNNKHTLVSAINELINKNYNAQFGVRFVGSETNGIRIGDAYDMTAVPQFSEQEAVVNDFDSVYPWCEMKRCVINEFGEIVAYEGEPGFFTNGLLGDVFVEIPKFYQKMYKDEQQNYIEYWISSVKDDGFWLNPAFKDGDIELDHIYIGCYEAVYENEFLYSRAGGTISGNKTLDEYRTLAKNKGKGFKLCDLLEHNLIEYLFMIEYATRNSQNIYKSNCISALYSTGMTDSLDKPSEASSDTYASPFRYRYLENIYGNAYEMVDGIYLVDNKIKLTTDISRYGSYNDYVTLNIDLLNSADTSNSSFFIADKLYNISLPYLHLPIYNADKLSSNNTYYSDYTLYSNDSYNKVILTGGRTGLADNAEVGLFTINGQSVLSTYKSDYTTTRLCYKPIK